MPPTRHSPDPAPPLAPYDRRAPGATMGDVFAVVPKRARAAIGAIAGVTAMLGTVAGLMGFRLLGPRDTAVALQLTAAAGDTALARRIDSSTVRIRVLEAHFDELDRTLREVQSQQHFNIYLTCVLFRRIDPLAAPPECGAIIQARRLP
ncbi:MAG: hypothetical protein JWO05_1143 [Gemmatimonadetes bacterium]|nr:hypothetical protein [Gemmatimonadota bacterium]